jgi:hypothetical protein
MISTRNSGEPKLVSQNLSLPKKGGYDLRSVLFEESTQKSNGEIQIYNLDALPSDVQDIGLEIPGIDFRVGGIEGGKVFVESDIYLTNEGKETSHDFRMLVKVREMDAGLLADKVWTQTGEVRPETTVIRSVNLTIPDQYNYIVEVLIWNNDTIVKRGEVIFSSVPKLRFKKKTPPRPGRSRQANSKTVSLRMMLHKRNLEKDNQKAHKDLACLCLQSCSVRQQFSGGGLGE